MGMVIHDDFWESAQLMPEKQRAPFLYALMLYRFEGKEPEGNPPWLPTFVISKKRLDLGDEASERGRKMAEARWGKKRADTAVPNSLNADACKSPDAAAYAQAYAQADADAHAQALNNPDAEVEIEVEIETPPYIPPHAQQDTKAPFWTSCLKALNDELVTTYTTMPEKCRLMLDRSRDTWTVEQVKAMVAYKRDEWQGTRYAKSLTPNTLFSPDHFEQYMHQSADNEREEGAYAEYR